MDSIVIVSDNPSAGQLGQSIRMIGRYQALVIAALSCLALGNAEQGHRTPEQQQHQDAARQPLPVPQPPEPPSPKKAEQPCYPESEKGVSCDGIAAKAAVDQARDADKQAAPIWWQFGVGVATFLAAVAAALYAGKAAKSAKETLAHERSRTDEEFRPWIDFNARMTPFGPIEGQEGIISFGVEVTYTNRGTFPAEDVSIGVSYLFARPREDGVVFSPQRERDDIEKLFDQHVKDRNPGSKLFFGETATESRKIGFDIPKSALFPDSVSFALAVCISVIYRSPKWKRTRYAQTSDAYLVGVAFGPEDSKMPRIDSWYDKIGQTGLGPLLGLSRLT